MGRASSWGQPERAPACGAPLDHTGSPEQFSGRHAPAPATPRPLLGLRSAPLDRIRAQSRPPCSPGLELKGQAPRKSGVPMCAPPRSPLSTEGPFVPQGMEACAAPRAHWLLPPLPPPPSPARKPLRCLCLRGEAGGGAPRSLGQEGSAGVRWSQSPCCLHHTHCLAEARGRVPREQMWGTSSYPHHPLPQRENARPHRIHPRAEIPDPVQPTSCALRCVVASVLNHVKGGLSEHPGRCKVVNPLQGGPSLARGQEGVREVRVGSGRSGRAQPGGRSGRGLSMRRPSLQQGPKGSRKRVLNHSQERTR